ncbi:efflux RND transporter periplasmic adaptor subunit [Teredinibacter purpureus]|jgi:RND family efflux transporter, MFP subunit|uniref:efflux RND transporter periplasmic adaptor subunit n=1 Tax=Teredinibacter purpureus TaxID=2731756 RepID=UPI0005F7EE34|nr:efflux RND transporter periplasmic adaptor subunit [Teredinibacter purpureus]
MNKLASRIDAIRNTNTLRRQSLRAGLTCVCLMVVVAFISGCTDSGANETKAEDEQVSVGVYTVSSQKDFNDHFYTGFAKAATRIDVISKVSGVVIKRNFVEGDGVASGAVLFEIERESYGYASEKAHYDVAVQRATYQQSQREFDRNVVLSAGSSVSESDIDLLKTRLEVDELNLRKREVEKKSAAYNLAETYVKAPIAGRTSFTDFTEGDFAVAGESKLVELINDSRMYVEFAMPELVFNHYFVGNKNDALDERVTVLVSKNGDRKVAATLNIGARRIKENQGAVILRAEFSNDDGLFIDGSFVGVEVRVANKKAPFSIPRNIVVKDNESQHVFKIDDNNVVQKLLVRVVEETANTYWVEGDLALGVRLASTNLQSIQDSARVTVEP